MGSYNYGKKEIVKWINEHVLKDATILDVGACDGKWRGLLRDYPNMDAVEVYQPNAVRIRPLYRHLYNCDICDFEYKWYDLVILGDILEHLTVEDAKIVLRYAAGHSKYAIISIPYLYKQGAIYGNPYEVHIQDDLTEEIFKKRYPECRLLLKAANDYAYYLLTGGCIQPEGV